VRFHGRTEARGTRGRHTQSATFVFHGRTEARRTCGRHTQSATFVFPAVTESRSRAPKRRARQTRPQPLSACGDLCLAVRSDRVAERHGPLLVQVVVRCVVRRKARRRGHAIAVGAVSQSCPSVGWMGKVSSGCAGRNAERKGGWEVVRDKLRWYVLARGMGAYRGEVLQRVEGGDQPEFCVRSR
jgi:hypothetical protein